MVVLLRKRKMQADDVAGCKNFREISLRDPFGLELVCSKERVEGNHFTDERHNPLCEGRPNSSEPKDACAERAQTVDWPGKNVTPLSFSHVLVVDKESPMNRKKKRQRMVGHFFGAIIRHVADYNSTLLAAIDVNDVVSHPE